MNMNSQSLQVFLNLGKGFTICATEMMQIDDEKPVL